MNLLEAVQLLAYINRATNQPVAEGAETVWHDLLGHLTQEEALDGLRTALSDTNRRDRWIAPADILSGHHLNRSRAWNTPAGSAPGGQVPIAPLPRTYTRFIEAKGVREILASSGQDKTRFDSVWRGTPCPHCVAGEQEPCMNQATNRRTQPHPSRLEAAKKGNAA